MNPQLNNIVNTPPTGLATGSLSFSSTPVGKIGWKEMGWKIGDEITCLHNIQRDRPSEDFWVDRLTIGKKYKIDDLEWRFFDRVCVVSDYNNRAEFVPVEFFFDTIAEKREKTIEDILKK